jgi:DHA1 family multidrug resistance protein-like MFS transporter
MPKMGCGRDYPPLLPNRDPYRVDFEGDDDPMFPQNWPLRKKVMIAVALGYVTFTVTWGSAVFAPAVPFVELEFHMGLVPTILGVSLYVLGFASGPILWAPLSELYGRKVPIVVSSLGFMLFCFAVATAKDFQTILICRFFAGFFGAAPLAVVAAAFADMFDNVTRGFATAVFAGAVFVGPLIAPVIGGFIADSKLHWRWTQYITGIMGALALFLAVFVYEETYHPIILCRKAVELRQRTGNWGIYAPHELIELDIGELVTKNLTRPVVMLFTEPILFLITLYTAFIYGLLYLLLEAYPIIFGEGYGMKGGVMELPYLGLVIGMLLGITSILVFFEPRYIRKVKQNNGKPVPEERLLVTVAGSIALPIGIFWLCWTGNYPRHIHWIVPTISGLFTGYGIIAIFLSAINYIVDSYLFFAASALAANTLLRSGFGAGFPLFATAMFHNLGINFAGTVLGCIAVALFPVPILFIIFGKRIRQRSKFAFHLG